MLEYPAIPREFREIPNAHIFDKLDGSNLRFEFTRAKGFHKYGLRHTRFGEEDRIYGYAVPKFKERYEEFLLKLFKKENWDKVTCFCEYFGPTTTAGLQTPQDDHLSKDVVIFDLAVNDEFIGPQRFRKLLEDKVPTPKFLGIYNWTRGFIDRIWNQDLEGITFEGVIAKSKPYNSKQLLMGKAKTKQWIDLIHKRFSPEEAEKIEKS